MMNSEKESVGVERNNHNRHRYYFDDPLHCEQLGRELMEWLKTPFRHHSGVKGFGVDCIHLVTLAMVNVGAFTPDAAERIPAYPKDWHLHNGAELILQGMRELTNCEELPRPLDSPMDGDIYLYRFGKASSHAGVYFRRKVYQAVTDRVAERIDWLDPTWYRRRRYGFRVLV